MRVVLLLVLLPALAGTQAPAAHTQDAAERLVPVDGYRMRVRTAGWRHLTSGVPAVATDARSEAQSTEYYKARGYTEEQVPKLRAEMAQRFKAAAGTEMAVAMELERTHFAEIRALSPLPDVPAAVLMAVKYDPSPWAGKPCQPRDCYDGWVKLRIGWLMPLVQASSDGTLTISTGSGHNMQRDDPALVVSAIRRIVTAATKRKERAPQRWSISSRSFMSRRLRALWQP